MTFLQENQQKQFKVEEEQAPYEMNGEMNGKMDAMMSDEFNTDAELQKAFKEMNDDMKITEDPISCIMDHKTCLFPCRTRGRPLYLEEALNRHKAEDHVMEIKEWHCRHCNKSFHRDGNKMLYRRNYEHGARSPSSAAAKIEGICYKKGKRNGNRNRNVTLLI